MIARRSCRAWRAPRPRRPCRRRRRSADRAATAPRACCHPPACASSFSAAGSKATPSCSRMCCRCAAICRRRQALQVELQAARQHRHRQLLRIGGREQELHVRRRLLERLQQRVEGVRREHVHLVDEVHLVATAGRGVLHVIEQLARVVDLGARGRIDLDQVDEAAGVDLAAAGADAARLGASRPSRSSGTWRGCARWWSCPPRACR